MIKTRNSISQKRVGFVPTMGALHEGHASLIREAKSRCDKVVVSIFVNPLQFGPNEDLAKYPRTLESDLALCKSLGVDVVFAPTYSDVYPEGFDSKVSVGRLGTVFCGHFRPGHFDGVATVVLKLFSIVRPDIAYFGQKDGQQCAVIKKMVTDLCLPVQIFICPTLRDEDGLAMSSRNRYLSPGDRKLAPELFQSLSLIVKSCPRPSAVILEETKRLQSIGFQIQYLAVVNSLFEELSDNQLTEISRTDSLAYQEILVIGAVLLGSNPSLAPTRLIDNLKLGQSQFGIM